MLRIGLGLTLRIGLGNFRARPKKRKLICVLQSCDDLGLNLGPKSSRDRGLAVFSDARTGAAPKPTNEALSLAVSFILRLTGKRQNIAFGGRLVYN